MDSEAAFGGVGSSGSRSSRRYDASSQMSTQGLTDNTVWIGVGVEANEMSELLGMPAG